MHPVNHDTAEEVLDICSRTTIPGLAPKVMNVIREGGGYGSDKFIERVFAAAALAKEFPNGADTIPLNSIPLDVTRGVSMRGPRVRASNSSTYITYSDLAKKVGVHYVAINHRARKLGIKSIVAYKGFAKVLSDHDAKLVLSTFNISADAL